MQTSEVKANRYNISLTFNGTRCTAITDSNQVPVTRKNNYYFDRASSVCVTE